MENDTLESLVKLLPLIQEAIPMDCMLSVADKEKFLRYLPGEKLNLQIPSDVPLTKGDGLYEVIKSGQAEVHYIPKEALGISFKAHTVPVRDEAGNVIGAFGIGVSTEGQDILQGTSQTLAASSQQITATIQEIASTSNQLAEDVNAVNRVGMQVLKGVENTKDILQFINEIAANSNLLGLNAAIEAARAGEHGRGFAVVAEEIRKMAVHSAESVRKIKEILEKINGEANELLTRVNNTMALSERQAAATEEISASMQELAGTTEALKNISKII